MLSGMVVAVGAMYDLKLNHRLGRWELSAALFLNIVFVASSLFWIFIIPYNDAPDENNHFRYSVEFIMTHHQLPVYGVDDVECFRNAASSYNMFPAVNYAVAALFGWCVDKLMGWPPYIGARLSSLFFGLVFINCLLAAARLLAGRMMPAVSVVSIVALIPQVVFVCSYINADAYALGVSGVLALAVAWMLREICHGAAHAIDRRTSFFLGVAVGLLFTAKLNFWVYLPVLGVGALWMMVTRRLALNMAFRLLLIISVVSLFIAGGWYWRNLSLYGVPLPSVPTTEWLAGIGVTNPPPRVLLANANPLQILPELVRRGYFMDTLEYFYGRFGYGTIGFSPYTYAMLKFLAPALIFLFVMAAVSRRDKTVVTGVFLLIGMLTLNLILLILYSMKVGYQPQGRYLFPVLAPASMWMAWSIGRYPHLLRYACPLIILHAWLLVHAHLLLRNTY